MTSPTATFSVVRRCAALLPLGLACTVLAQSTPPASETPTTPPSSGEGAAAAGAGTGAAEASTGTAGGVEAVSSQGILPIPDYSGDLLNRRFLTGDWGGARKSLAEKGIQINVDWVQTLQSVPSGGLSNGTRYGGSLDYVIMADLYRMGLVPGGLVKLRAETRYGQDVNRFPGTLAPVSTDGFFPLSADDIPFTITDLTYYQFFCPQFGAFVGKIDTLDADLTPFASGRGNTQFMNSNFVFNPIAVMAVPYSTLATGVIVQPIPDISITSTVMSTADSSTTTGFQNLGDGWTWSTQAMFQYRLGTLPGGQNLIFIYAGDNDYLNINGRFSFKPGQGIVAPRSDNTWALMWTGWQYLHTAEEQKGPLNLDNGPPNVQGVGVFTRVGVADEDTNPMGWTVSAGLGGQGILPGREDDLFGVGYSYVNLQTGRILSAAGVEDNTQAFEAFYSIALTPAVALTLDLQLVSPFQPNTSTAVVLGMRLMVNF